MWEKGRGEMGRLFTGVVGTAPEVPSGDLMSIELERYETAEDAVAANPLGWKRLVENWNKPGGNRFDIPGQGVSDVPPAVYAPQARAGYEDVFGERLGKGMDDVDLYVIHVPHSWTPNHLQNQIYKWAALCQVSYKWIPMWSAFRARGWSNRFTRPQSECRPGGRCLILTHRCDGSIFSAVETEV